MTHFSDLAVVPQGFATEEFIVRPLLVADVDLDYAAVMESKVELRPWEQTGWPADDFTVADDLADLEDLEQRAREKRSFTYTVMTPDETECLGCVYFMPHDAKSYARAEITALATGSWEQVGATVSFWVRTSRLADGLERRLLDAVLAWVDDEWEFTGWVVMTNEQCPAQRATIEAAGLAPSFRVQGPGQPGAYLAFDRAN